MNRVVFTAALLLVLVAAPRPAAADEDAPRVVLLSLPEQQPPAEMVRSRLSQQLESVGVRVDVEPAEIPPGSSEAWAAEAKKAAKRPGTLALIGWACDGQDCLLTVADARSGAIVEVPVRPGGDRAAMEEIAFAVASTAREAIVGSLLPELSRLRAEGEAPSPPPPTGDRVPQAYHPESGPDARGVRPWLWLEGGYHGEHPYPQGRPLHGPWIGLAMEARRSIVPAVSTGWLGLQRVVSEAGVVRSHRVPVNIELRIAIPVGPSTFSVSPAGRFDVVFASAEPAGPHGDSSSVEFELHVGGRTSWNLPLPGGIEAVLGAGILGTLLGHDYSVADRRAIAESTLRFGWWVGVAWSPIG